MDYTFLFYYTIPEMNIRSVFHNIHIEFIRDINEKDISGKLVKFNNTDFNSIIQHIDKIKNEIKMDGVDKYEIQQIDLDSVKNVYIILPT